MKYGAGELRYFHRVAIQKGYVSMFRLKVLCSEGPLFRKSDVQKHLFRRSYAIPTKTFAQLENSVRKIS